MKLNYQFEEQFIDNVINATNTKLQLDKLNQKWLKGLQVRAEKAVLNYVENNFSTSAAMLFYKPEESVKLFPSQKTVLLSESLIPTKGSPNSTWNAEVILLKPIPIPAEMGRVSEISLSKIVLPYTQLASTKKLVAEAQTLAKEINNRRWEIKQAITNARNMKKFCQDFPEFVKHLPHVGESSVNLALIANLRKMGFDNTVATKKAV